METANVTVATFLVQHCAVAHAWTETIIIIVTIKVLFSFLLLLTSFEHQKHPGRCIKLAAILNGSHFEFLHG